MKIVFLFILILSLTSVIAQTIAIDTVDNKRILIGKVNREHIADSSWVHQNYNEGIVTPGTLSTIEKESNGVSVQIFFGTWCDDSQFWVPAFIGVMDKAKSPGQMQLIALSRSKKSEETVKLEEIIDKVPTFVFFRNGKEIGRIIESPQETLAKDMIKILKQ